MRAFVSCTNLCLNLVVAKLIMQLFTSAWLESESLRALVQMVSAVTSSPYKFFVIFRRHLLSSLADLLNSFFSVFMSGWGKKDVYVLFMFRSKI